MEKASTSSLRLARMLVQSLASPALRPTSRLFSSPFSSTTSIAASRRPPTAAALSAARPMRPFSSTPVSYMADQPPNNSAPPKPSDSTPAPSRPSSGSLMEGLADLLPSSRSSGSANSASLSSYPSSSAAGSTSSPLSASSLTGLDDLDRMKQEVDQSGGEYHFAIYAHRHNTHICVSKPNNDVILSLSCGHIGFRKAARSSYDAAYQLGAYVCDRLYQKNWHKTIQRMRVSIRGFGQGRAAVTKILLGMEGRPLRTKITKVSDTTRVKFGGTRSKGPRRL